MTSLLLVRLPQSLPRSIFQACLHHFHEVKSCGRRSFSSSVWSAESLRGKTQSCCGYPWSCRSALRLKGRHFFFCNVLSIMILTSYVLEFEYHFLASCHWTILWIVSFLHRNPQHNFWLHNFIKCCQGSRSRAYTASILIMGRASTKVRHVMPNVLLLFSSKINNRLLITW